MSDDGSDTSTLDERPVYFKVFTRESLVAIRERAEEEAIRLKEEAAKKAAEEVSKPIQSLNQIQQSKLKTCSCLVSSFISI